MSTATAPARPATTPTHRWVANRREDGWAAAQHKHLLALRSGDQGTTLCGASGMGEGVFFANQSKPECGECRAEAERDPEVVIRPRHHGHSRA